MVAAGSWRPSRSKTRGEDCQRDTHGGDAAGVVVVADRHGQVVEALDGVAVFGRKADTLTARPSRSVGYRSLGRSLGPGAGVVRGDRIHVAVGYTVCEQRETGRIGIVGGVGRREQALEAALASSSARRNSARSPDMPGRIV